MLSLALALAAFAAQDKVGLPPGDEGLDVVVTRPRWKGITFRADRFGGSGLKMDVSDPTHLRDDGITPPDHVRLDIEEKDFEAFGAGVVVDFELFRLSIDAFMGDWEGEGTLTVSDGVNPPVATAVDLEGETWGLHFGLHWPGLRGRWGGLEASLGPQLSVGWQHEELDPVVGDPAGVHHDEVNELVGRAGLRLGVRVHAGEGAWFSLEAEGALQAGSSVGFVSEISVGFGFRF